MTTQAKTTGQAENFIREHLLLEPVEGLVEISIHKAHPRSGLARLTGDKIPYWAFAWAGGAVLARYVLDHPESVAGQHVLDLGAGSGIVGIAAAKAGARSVIACETDPIAAAVLRLNAEANGVTLGVLVQDITQDDELPDVDMVLAGDVFYSRPVARRMLGFLRRCRSAGLDMLIGDPGRTHLPAEELRAIARYDVIDMGSQRADTPATVYKPAPRPKPEPGSKAARPSSEGQNQRPVSA